MKLYYSEASPFARKVRACAIECGLDEAIELIPAAPLDSDDAVHQVNPLGRVPALVTEDGFVLVDSPVICEYLDSRLAGVHPLYPPSGPKRWAALRRQALGDGLMDSAVAWRQELMRPENLRSEEWLVRRERQVRGTLAYLQTLSPEWDLVDIGNLSIACALGYLQFRFAEWAWSEQCPELFAWFEQFSARDSLLRTRPQ